MRRTSSGGNLFSNIKKEVTNIGEQIGGELMKKEEENEIDLSVNSN